MRVISCMFMIWAIVWSAADRSPAAADAKAYDIGKNGADKGDCSIRIPTADGGCVLRTKAMTGIAFFGDRLADCALAFRIPVSSLAGVDAKTDAEVAKRIGLDVTKSPAVLFRSTSITEGKKDEPHTYRVRGKLTFLGIEKDVLFEGMILELTIPGGRERGFIGDGLNLQLAAVLDPAAFGVAVPTPNKNAETQEMTLRFNVFALTNDKPQRDQKTSIEDVLYPRAAESRPSEDAPASRPAKKN